MAKVCFVLVAGLDGALLDRAGDLPTLGQLARSGRLPMKPVTPAVTCTMQATLTTGKGVCDHGIIANGLHTHRRTELHSHLDLSSFPDYRKEVSFWEQSNSLLEAPRFWHHTGGCDCKVAMLFWQNSMDGAADVVLTPKPTHTPDGKTLTACWSSPTDLYAELTAKLGPFPLMNYWGPMANINSSRWIIQSAVEVWNRNLVDLLLVYIPHMDYNLQRLGPDDARVMEDLRALDDELAALANAVQATGGKLVVAGDYGMNSVRRAALPNRALRDAGLLTTRTDPAAGGGGVLVDYNASAAFAMVDHQIAHVYCDGRRRPEVVQCVSKLEGVAHILAEPEELELHGLCHGRAGDVVLLAEEDAWFAHDWWTSDAEKPAWQFSVDIHRKPGYDPRELFFDPVKKTIAQDPALVRGSHGLVGKDPARWPVLLCDAATKPQGDQIHATAVADWLKRLLTT